MKMSLLVIAPHPDDEILGAGSIMARVVADGGRVAVVVLTDGAKSNPMIESSKMANIRERECIAGLTEMIDAPVPMLFLRHSDGLLDSTDPDHSVTSKLYLFCKDFAPDTILVTDPADGHSDHKAAFGIATRLISAGLANELQVMPISQRIDKKFDRAGYNEISVNHHKRKKTRALSLHVSQLGESSGFTLSRAVQIAFCETEYLKCVYDRGGLQNDVICPSHFDELFSASADPWGYDVEPYEADRFGRTIAALADRRYQNALELGCANGALTAQLAPLCERLVATDASKVALTKARARLKGVGGLEFQHCILPTEVPLERFDLIVASDVLYYLGLKGVIALMARIDAVATQNCRVLIASFLGPTDTRLTGEMASEAAIAHLVGWRRTHTERTERLRMDVLERR